MRFAYVRIQKRLGCQAKIDPVAASGVLDSLPTSASHFPNKGDADLPLLPVGLGTKRAREDPKMGSEAPPAPLCP